MLYLKMPEKATTDDGLDRHWDVLLRTVITLSLKVIVCIRAAGIADAHLGSIRCLQVLANVNTARNNRRQWGTDLAGIASHTHTEGT